MTTLISLTTPNETWMKATWDDYLQAENNSDDDKSKLYYYQGQLKIQMSPLGNDHASDHSIINYGIHLYASLKNIDLNGKDNCTYHKIGSQAAQPDLSYYTGKNVDAIAYGTQIINLDHSPAPSLVIEIANSSLKDDLGMKRLLYENLGIEEYWIVDVQSTKIIAFAIADGGSKRIYQSVVLPSLEINILENALQKTRQENHSKVGVWLLQIFQS
jgi:Uma2 family endonuclease